MKGALRFTLAYFSGAALLSWLSLIGAVLVGSSMLFAVLARSAAFSSGAANVALWGIVAMVVAPAYSGGLWLRNASTPVIMHLRPHGRRQMLLAATLTITLTAALVTLGAMIEKIWPLGNQGSNAFGLAPAAAFQLVWGCIGLVWVTTFTLSSRPMLQVFSGIPFLAVIMMWGRLDGKIPFTRETLASSLFAAGVAAWIIFALWYLKAPNVLRRRLLSARSGKQTLLEFDGLVPARWLQRFASGDTRASRTKAMRQYLLGAYSARNCLAIGAALTLFGVAMHYLPLGHSDPPLIMVLITTTLIGAMMGAMCVPRARMLWMRAGLDRSTLFATAERLTLQATVLYVAIPVAAVVTRSLMEQPSLAAAIILHTTTQMAFATCALFAGMTYIRGAPQIFGLFVVLGLPSLIAMVKLDPHTVTSPWPHIGAVLLFSALALLLRGLARRSWSRLDWRLTGPPLQRGSL